MLYPLNLELRGRRCTVIGGGRVAERKIGALLAAGARIEQPLPGGATVLMLASALGMPDIAARLLAAGADVHAGDAQGLTPLHAQLIANHGFTELLPILASQGSRSKVSWASSGAIGWEIIAFCVRSGMTSWLSLPPPLAIAAKFTTEARYAGFF